VPETSSNHKITYQVGFARASDRYLFFWSVQCSTVWVQSRYPIDKFVLISCSAECAEHSKAIPLS